MIPQKMNIVVRRLQKQRVDRIVNVLIAVKSVWMCFKDRFSRSGYLQTGAAR